MEANRIKLLKKSRPHSYSKSSMFKHLPWPGPYSLAAILWEAKKAILDPKNMLIGRLGIQSLLETGFPNPLEKWKRSTHVT